MAKNNSHLKSLPANILTRIFAVKPGEWLMFSLMGLYVFANISSYLILKTVSRSMFLHKVGSDYLPYIYIMVAVIVGVIASIYGRYSKKSSILMLVLITDLVIIVNLAVFWYLLNMKVRDVWLFYTFYIWVSIFGVLVPSQYWLLANHIYNPREAKRLFGPLAGVAIAGGIFGGYFTRFTVHLFGTENLLIVNIFFQIIMGILLMVIWRAAGLSEKETARKSYRSRKEAKKDSIINMYREIMSMKHLRLLIAIIGTTVIVVQLADFLFMNITEKTFPDQNDKTAFIGFWSSNLSVISLLLQFFLAQRILQRFGVITAICFLPVGLALGNLGLLLYPAIGAAVILKVSDGAFRYSLNKSGMELLYLPLSTGLKDRTKTFIDMVVDRAGRGVSGIILLLAIKFQLPVSQICLIGIITVGLWLFFIFRMRAEYVNTFRNSLAKRTLNPDMLALRINDPSHVSVLIDTLKSENPAQVSFALSLLADTGNVDLSPHLQQLVTHASPRVRNKVWKIANQRGDHALITDLENYLKAETNADVYRSALDYYCSLEPDMCREYLLSDINRSDTGKFVWDAEFIADHADNDRFAGIIDRDRVERFLSDDDTNLRITGILLLGCIDAVDILKKYRDSLLSDSSIDVQRAFISVLGASGNRAFVPDLFNALNNKKTRSVALEALSSYGERIYGIIRDSLLDEEEEMVKRRIMPNILQNTGSQEAANILLMAMDVKDDTLRFKILRSLNKLKKRSPGLRFDRNIVETQLKKDILHALQLYSVEEKLGSDTVFSKCQFLKTAITENREKIREIIFRTLGLIYNQDDMLFSYQGITSDNRRRRANALEFLENILEKQFKQSVFSVIDEITPDKQKEIAGLFPGYGEGNLVDTLQQIMEKGNNFITAAIFHCAMNAGAGNFQNNAMKYRHSPVKMVNETANRYLDIIIGKPLEKGDTMYSIIERVIILQNVDFFSQCKTRDLAEIAAIADEVEYDADQGIFSEGDPNDALYVVLSGSVRSEKDGNLVANISQNQAFGVWSLFDDEPRLVSVTANEHTRMLRIDREDFFDLLSEQFEITQNIFQAVVGRLKQLVK